MKVNCKTMQKKTFCLFVFLFLAISFMLSLCSTSNAMAAESYSEIFTAVDKKAHAQNIYRCYKHNKVKGEVFVKDYLTIKSLLKSPEATFALSKDGKESCGEVFNRYRNKAPTSTQGPEEIKKFLKNMGYTISGSANEDLECHYLTFSYGSSRGTDGKRKSTPKVCVDKNKKVSIENYKSNKKVEFYFYADKKLCMNLFGATEQKPSLIADTKCVDLPKKPSEVNGKLRQLVSRNCGGSYTCRHDTGEIIVFNPDDKKDKSAGEVRGFIIDNDGERISAGKTASVFLTDEKWPPAIKGKSKERASLTRRLLYQGYLRDFYGLDVKCDSKYEGAWASIEWYPLKNMGKKTKAEKCYYNDVVGATENKDKRVNGLDGNGFLQIGTMSFQDVLDAVKAMAGEEYPDAVSEAKEIDSNAEEEEEKNAESESIEAMCRKAEVKGVSWLLCPTIDNMTETAGGLSDVGAGEEKDKHNNFLDTMLNVKSDLYGPNSSLRVAWELIRNLSNFVMIIILLAIIFSQLTGVGINNYGIKKALPKFVVMAILMNLSFLICEVLVDLSNIFGEGLRDLFRQVGDVIFTSKGIDATSVTVAGLVTALFGAAGIAGAGAGTAMTVLSFSAIPGAKVLIIIVVALALLAVVAALIVFFLMLGARFVIIIGCVILAPLACVFYILPGTQNLSKKWWSAFKVALLIYPICGAVSGIGYSIKAITYTTDGASILLLITSMIVPFLPYFMLPSLLREAINALGKIGGAFQTMGDRFSGGVRNLRSAVENSDKYKDAMNHYQTEAGKERARRTIDKLNAIKTKKQGHLTAWESSALARQEAKLAQYNLNKSKEYGEIFENESLDEVLQETSSAIGEDNADALKISAGLADIGKKGGAEKKFGLMDDKKFTSVLNNMMKKDKMGYNHLMQSLTNDENDVIRAFAKYRLKGGASGFKDWREGKATDKSAMKEWGSYGSYLDAKGPGALNNYTKDEMALVEGSADILKKEMDEMNKGEGRFESMIGNAAINATDARAQNQVMETIESRLRDNKMEVNALGLTGESLGSMRGDVAEAMVKGYAQRKGVNSEEDAMRIIRSELSEQIAAAEKDPRILNKMDQNTRRILGISMSAAAPTPNGAARENETFNVNSPITDPNSYIDYQQGRDQG